MTTETTKQILYQMVENYVSDDEIKGEMKMLVFELADTLSFYENR